MDIKKKAKGFTIIEVIFVIVILAILFGIVIVTYPNLVRNMKIRSDRSSAAYITKALRGWYADGMSDPQKQEEFKAYLSNNLYLKTVKFSELSTMGVDIFVDSNYIPYSLVDESGHSVDDQDFYIGIIGEGSDSKFVVTIETSDERLSDISSVTEPNYDGESIGVIYIES